MNKKIRDIDDHAELYIDSKTGIATIKDGRSGCSHSVHPSIDASGSVSGMRKHGGWGKKDKVERSGGFYYNTSMLSYDPKDKYDAICKEECRCAACRQRKTGKEPAR